VIIFFSCGSDDDTIENNDTETLENTTTDVYAVGFELINANFVTKIWKNEQEVVLETTSEQSWVTGLYVINN